MPDASPAPDAAPTLSEVLSPKAGHGAEDGEGVIFGPPQKEFRGLFVPPEQEPLSNLGVSLETITKAIRGRKPSV